MSHEKESLTQDLEGLEKRLDLLPQNSSTMANEIQSSLNELREELSENLSRRDFLDSELAKNNASIDETRKRTEASKRERTQVLRMPTEKGESGKRYLWVVVKYGKIYPCFTPKRAYL